MFCLDPGDHTCWQDSRCGLQDLWGDVRVAVRGVFERTTLADLAARHRRLTQPLISPDQLLTPG
jgi:DNA-binding IscR family transcriptional regulator